MTNKKKNILLMGPISPPFTGQSVVFTSVVSSIQMTENVVLINISNKESIISGIILCLRIICAVIFKKIDTIYFTCSRTFAGSIRDAVMLFCARIKNIRVVNHLHGSDFKSFYSKLPDWYKKVIFWTYSGIETSIVLIEGMEEQFDLFPLMKKVVVKNCYSKDMECLPTIKERNNDIINILFLSNIMRSKGIIHLLDACDELFLKYENISLNIAGEIQRDSTSTFEEIKADFLERLMKLQAKYPKRINYLGVCKGKKKNALLWESDIFILPTFYITEAFPISILEAMRSGNYIISTKYKYIPQIVTKNIGKLIEPESTTAIINAFDEVLCKLDELKCVQNYNIDFAKKNYDENRFLNEIQNVILY